LVSLSYLPYILALFISQLGSVKWTGQAREVVFYLEQDDASDVTWGVSELY